MLSGILGITWVVLSIALNSLLTLGCVSKVFDFSSNVVDDRPATDVAADDRGARLVEPAVAVLVRGVEERLATVDHVGSTSSRRGSVRMAAFSGLYPFI